MKKALFFVAALAAASATARATEPPPFTAGFSSHAVQAGGRTIYYRIGGSGPAVLLLHGYGDTGQMWSALAPVLAKTHTVVVPDLPGLGNSRPENPNAQYDMASVARSIHALMVRLKVRHEAVVGHDIGLILAYSYAAQFRNDVTKLVLMDGPIPGVGPWQTVLLFPGTWHFHFYGTNAEELTAGRERIYLDWLWNRFAFHPERIGDAERAAIAASYAQPGTMRVGFTYFKDFDADAAEDAAFAKTPLQMPVLAMGGEKSFAPLMAAFAKAVAAKVRISVIPDSGHWLMDENPAATIAALSSFLAAP
ncbi:MAG TPA: alpha/beta hydrolase [Candidatus Acidoferrales bacterium]|nr:alpha/beta hydrolase [Candidatus Acidoferrales bacterium]